VNAVHRRIITSLQGSFYTPAPSGAAGKMRLFQAIQSKLRQGLLFVQSWGQMFRTTDCASSADQSAYDRISSKSEQDKN